MSYTRSHLLLKSMWELRSHPLILNTIAMPSTDAVSPGEALLGGALSPGPAGGRPSQLDLEIPPGQPSPPIGKMAILKKILETPYAKKAGCCGGEGRGG